ncbi:flagellar protein FlaG [Breznakiella homolactica]|uniref:Flagellar protein FlaG n=1 Tax=Breznakiella homolactica TaxID=2798577 RepID=A0A7T8B9T7_9SPIR|nr:flagellar protein FlaG [Breznakiella homolactica]QQO07533.1 flagellar protein FlaG [Breznakiella homolactica]
MGMPITGVGNGFPYQELPQDRGSVKTQVQSAEARAAARETFVATLPGEREAVDIKTTTADLERISLAFNRKLKFVVDHESHQVTVKVIDPETDKVIKVLPPEELQRLHFKLKETIGFLFDEQV